MTNANTAALLERVEDLTSALVQAQEDFALLERITKAKAETKRLAVELEAAQEALAEAMAAEVQERREATYAGLKDITITERNTQEGLLGRTFEITYVRDQWDGYGSTPVEHVVNGFGSLPDEAWGYLLNVRQDQIPLSILALSPTADPWDAFITYFTGLKRGWLSAPVTDADAA